MSPTTTVRVLVPVLGGLPESLITIGTRYSFCCSLSKDLKELTIATPSPFAPSVEKRRLLEEKRKSFVHCDVFFVE
jgi:hypothetical protein